MLAKTDLTVSQAKIIRLVTDNRGKLTQKALEERLQVSHPTIVGLVGRLEKKGYLSCDIAEDHRNKLVFMTEKANVLSKSAREEIDEIEKTLLAGFTIEDKNKLRDMLQRLYDNLGL